MFIYSTIDRITSGIISAGGITYGVKTQVLIDCPFYNKNWKHACRRKLSIFASLRPRHWRKSPSCPNDVLTVGILKTEVIDLTVSDDNPDIVVSNTRWGGLSAFRASLYFGQTEQIT